MTYYSIVANWALDAGMKIALEKFKRDYEQLVGSGIMTEEEYLNEFANPIIAQKFREAMNMAPVRVDPLILDLNGDGIQISNLSSGVYFDLNKDNFKEKTQWISKEDGFLVRDINGDGIINNGGELFGDQTIKSDGTIAIDGFDALRDYDENNDNIINYKDSIYSELKVWKDNNLNGKSESDELFSLNDLSINEISLNAVNSSSHYVTADGNRHVISNLFLIIIEWIQNMTIEELLTDF